MMRLPGFHALVFGALCAGTSVSDERLRRIPVVDTTLMASPEARQRFKYLTSCALGPEVEFIGAFGEQVYGFPGGIGLAPNWAERPLTKTERRWISACLLARTNAFGLPVHISMRAENPLPSLNASPSERVQFPVHEAGFFGDLFTDEPRAYVCLRRQTDAKRALQESQHRVCSHRIGPGANTTKCGFRIVGVCPGSGSVLMHDETWSEIIHVYLPGTQPPER